jgi:predicted glycogen debranching enzyme
METGIDMRRAGLAGEAEWLEADGLGGFASGTVSGVRTRRYHSLLTVATTPPTGRFALVNGLEVWVTTPAGRFALSSQRYAAEGQGDGVVHPDPPPASRIESFTAEPWPTWVYRLPDGTRIRHEITMRHGSPVVAASWTLLTKASAGGEEREVSLSVRPLLSGRDYHGLHRENAALRFDAEVEAESVTWRMYAGVPGVRAVSSGAYVHGPVWYRNFLYLEERDRGFDCREDLASPGEWRFDLSGRAACLVLAAEINAECRMMNDESHHSSFMIHHSAAAMVGEIQECERARRAALGGPLERAADAYIVRRGERKTIIAGYPWFADWGRDTFIAIRGLCLATGRLEDARSILLRWCEAVSQGQLPNRFPDRGDEPEYNAVDASLWFIIAVHEFLQAASDRPGLVSEADRLSLGEAINAIMVGYTTGTRHGIRLDSDGLLAAGRPGVQLTWMDARVGERVITPRIGKPVEVQALWINALRAACAGCECWEPTLRRALASFRRRFVNEHGYLNDVVDVNHQPDTVDATLRPNQILAVGGLPMCLLEPRAARRVVDRVEKALLTPLGLRSLDPADPAYSGRYQGGPAERDAVYHQGPVWPWLLGPFVEAWVRVRGGTNAAKRKARKRFLEPMLRHLEEAGLGHVSEIADGDVPHTPRGCPFQAWSVAELLRLDRVVLREAEEEGEGGAAMNDERGTMNGISGPRSSLIVPRSSV